jgi:hypothetical protein
VAFPLLVLMTLRLRLLGATAGALVATGIATWFTLHGVGPIGGLEGLAASGRIQMLQIYFLAAILSTLPLAIILAQRASLLASLRRNVDIRRRRSAHGARSVDVRFPRPPGRYQRSLYRAL